MKAISLMLVFFGLLSLVGGLLNANGFFDGSSTQPSALQLYGWVGVVAIGSLVFFGRMWFADRNGDER